MDKYIIELLDTNTRVIIPDFGAFIIKQKEPRLIVFNEFLRYNDGLLVDYVAKSENIEKDVAKKKVSEFVEKAANNLKDNNENILSGLGKLKKESTGKITFEESTETSKKDTRGKAAPKASEVKEEKKIKAEEEKKATPEKEVKAGEISGVAPEAATRGKISETKAKEQPVEKKEEQAEKKENPVEQKDKPAEQKEKPADEKEKPVEQRAGAFTIKSGEKKDTISQKRPEPAIRPAVERKVETRQKKKSNSQIIIWIILIVVINAAIISWFVFNNEIRGFLDKDSKGITDSKDDSPVKIGNIEAVSEESGITAEESDEAAAAGIMKQELEEPETAPEIEEEPVSYSEKRYYIVAGCFREESNANGLVKKLTREGYDAEKFGKIGNLHAVSYASFIDRTEAQRKLREIREQETEAWLIYY